MGKCLICLMCGWLYFGKYCCVKLGNVLFSLCCDVVVIVLKMSDDLLEFDKFMNIVVVYLGMWRLMCFKLFWVVLYMLMVLCGNE